MLIIKDRKAVVLKLRNPNKVLKIIPSAKQLSINGQPYVAVKHGLEETKVLRNMGISTPSPINHYYPFEGRFPPFDSQRKTAGFLTLHDRAYCLNSIGTGKTMAVLWAVDYLKKMGMLKKVLIVSPLSTLERTWGDEIFNNFPELTFSVLYGTKAKRLKLLKEDVDIYIINHHGIKVIKEELAKRDDIELVVIDELSQAARNQGTDIWKALNMVCNVQFRGKRRVWGLTGTPTPNLPTDAWAQCRLLTPKTVPVYFRRFRDATMRQHGPYTWVPRPDAVDQVREAMQPAIRFTRDQCLDLPPTTYIDTHAELTKEQHASYKEMQRTLKAEMDGGEVLAVNEAVKMSKLVQIACGVAYNAKGEELCEPAKNRLEVVLEYIEASEGKTIVYVPFVSAIRNVAQFLADAGHSVGVVYGGVAAKKRNKIFSDFQKEENPRVLVAQPASMSHGLTLTEASTIIWFAPICSNDIYEQANGRITRPGQKNKQLIVNIEGTGVERMIYNRLKDKQKLQGLLLDLVKEG